MQIGRIKLVLGSFKLKISDEEKYNLFIKLKLYLFLTGEGVKCVKLFANKFLFIMSKELRKRS